MKLEVLVATMNRTNCDFLDNMHLTTDAVVINQCNQESQEIITNDMGQTVKFYSYVEKGLSRSRNRALDAATGDICLIADDDVVYESDYEQKILDAYSAYPDADLIAFQMFRTGNTRLKTFRSKPSKQNWISCMKISSVEITFKRSSVLNNNIHFNTLFGAGAYFNNGEENIFLHDCLKKHLKIMYVPVNIGHVCCEESSWFTGYNSHYFKSMGAGYDGMSHLWSTALICQHLIRHYHLYKKDMSFFKILHLMFLGKKECHEIQRTIDGDIRIFLVGDFQHNDGPAIVNKNLRQVIGKSGEYSLATGKFSRILELLYKSAKAEVIGFSGLSQLNKLGIIWAKLLHKPTFYIMHGYVEKENSINNIKIPKLNNCEKYTLKHIDKIICVSERFKDYMQKIMPQYAHKFEFVNNGISWEQLEEQQQIQKDNTHYTIISMGGGMKRKNNLAVCQAIEQIKHKVDKPIHYIVIGQPYTDQKLICSYSFVEYIEYLSHKDILQLLQTGDLYIQNSYFDTFCLGVVEALISGCDLLISENIGALTIFKDYISEDIIENVTDINEISEKILYNLSNHNHERLLQSINKQSTSWEASYQHLKQVIGLLKYKGLMFSGYFKK